MKSIKTTLTTTAALALLTTGAFAHNHGGDKDKAAATANIVETAVAAGNFTTLAAALEAAGLAETVATGGPFTVFAPTDDAFAKLPEGTVEGLLADKEALKNVLLYHVVDGKVPAKDVVTVSSAKTLQGEKVKVAAGDNVTINDATVIKADIMASNGIIHVIDTVLIPPAAPTKSIVETAVEAGQFTTLAAALTAAGLVETLDKGEGPFTVFAPTDEAFAKLPEGTVEGLLADPEALKSVLLYHVVEGKVKAEDVVKLDSAKTLQGGEVKVSTSYGTVSINNAKVVTADVKAKNGVIHVIDTVLIPAN